MDYTQITDSQRADMLATIGVEDVESLFAVIPSAMRFDDVLDLPPAKSEHELQRTLSEMAADNRGAHDMTCFMGGGASDHFCPAVVDALASRGEFLTAYTPYQAEASQGALQVFFEFQTHVARLAGLDLANASLYEGATAVAESVLMALRGGGHRVLAASTLHPDTLAVLRTYLQGTDADLVELPAEGGRIDPATVAAHADDETAAVVIQSPNCWGLIEDWTGCFASTHDTPHGDAVAVFHPIACGLLRTPGACGADIAAGEGQPLGVPLSWGGPYLGLCAARKEFMRRMPGRLIGRTLDRDGRPAYCLTLQAREQHIRGAKATSNVCTNQGLLAIRATIFLSCLGTRGLREMAELCWHKAHYLAGRITELDSWSMKYDGAFFNEFCVRGPVDAAVVLELTAARGILAGVAPADEAFGAIGEPQDLLITVTEQRTRAEMDALVGVLSEVRA